MLPLEYVDKYDETQNKEIDYSNAIIKDYYKALPKLSYPRNCSSRN